MADFETTTKPGLSPQESRDEQNASSGPSGSGRSQDIEAQAGSADNVTQRVHHAPAAHESEFVHKYGPVNFVFIERPPLHPLWTRPHALNYFYDGILHRSKGERGSGRFELFLDLLYVGIVANLARAATEEPTGESLLKYVLLFLPAWQVWSDLRDFMNYYYNNDLTQKILMLWVLALLVVYANNANTVLESHKETGLVVGTYVIARMSVGLVTFIYTFFIKEHRRQMRVYFVSSFCICCLWLAVIWVGVRAKIAIAFVCVCLEITTYSVTFHPWFKKMIGARYSTAVNIEHEVDRIAAFYVIALGEFLYGIVASSPAGHGFTHNLARAIMSLIIAYTFCWFYFNGEGSAQATHALRRSVITAFLWVYLHIPIIGSLILAADAGSDLVASNVESTKKHPKPETEEAGESGGEGATAGHAVERRAQPKTEREVETHYSLQFFFTGGLCVALLCLTALSMLDESMDPPGSQKLPKFLRLVPRIPIAIVILCLSFAELNTTLLMGLVALLLVVLLSFETYAGLPDCATEDGVAPAEF